MNRSGRTACKRLEVENTTISDTSYFFFREKLGRALWKLCMYVLAERLLLKILENSSLHVTDNMSAAKQASVFQNTDETLTAFKFKQFSRP